MQGDRLERVERLFHEALEREPRERAAFLEEACGGDPDLRARVEALLAADRRAADFLDEPAWALLDGPRSGEGARAEPGLPFERLGEHRLVRRLGEGGMGVVYEAVQQPLGRRVALKVIRPERVGSAEAQARFWREVETIAALRHPGIVTVFGGGEDQGTCYFAMELIEGRGLDEILDEAARREAAPDDERILRWTLEVAEGLVHAHACGVIHRDVKPSNIRVTADERAMLLDFGVARHLARVSLTVTGEFRGTPQYASPEQVRGSVGKIDGRTDVYSLGAMLYEALTGRVPFEGDTAERVFRMILEEDPPPARSLRPSISRDLETVITTAMEKERRHRYPSMQALADDLRRVLAGEPIAARPPGWVRRSTRMARRHRRISAGAAVALLLLVGVAATLAVVGRQGRWSPESAEQMFVPMDEAFGFVPRSARRIAWMWTLAADPGDPGGHVLRALDAIESGELAVARGALEECIAACGPRGEADLESEAHHLLGLVGHGLAREAGGGRSSAGASSLRELRLNPKHHLAHLQTGMSIVGGLHRGGEVEQFEEAIAHLEEVLRARPRHVVSLLFLGRTYYFLARSHGFLGLVDEAEAQLQRALALSGEEPYHVIHNTLGALALLRGEHEQALEWNRKALAVAPAQNAMHAHNIAAGVAAAHAGMGRFEEARRAYLEVLRKAPDDAGLCLGMARMSLRAGEEEEALDHARRGAEMWTQPPQGVPAAARVVMACVELRRGEDARALDLLLDTVYSTAFCARDLGQACFLLATLPEATLRSAEQEGQFIGVHLERMATRAGHHASFEGRRSPIGCSTIGVLHWYRGSHGLAIDYLEEAISARDGWPRAAREHHWTEDARDRYFLAMAHWGLSAEEPGHADRARECFDAAEAAALRNRAPIEDVDVISRVRDRARDALSRDP